MFCCLDLSSEKMAAEIVSNLPNSENLNTKNGNFICGVVEGFYGRPWTTEQRKDLFQKMKKWGMDSYVYAPKDDYKHRAYWRELYTVEEAEHLTGLIQAAKDQNITFYYALSPGLDITYSNTKEITTLKRKLEQVSQFGCGAFALLFDDIEPEMSEADKEVFQSFAQAQVSITNDIYQHLGHPKFLLCPTQYCSTRAVPNVTNSEYLNTLGSKLVQQIDIMWTGQKVISRTLTKENIQEITDALRRPPVIWDNLHANDYDQKRVFLGPYSGRSPDLIQKLRGVLTNPNCEYSANFVAIHTLAQWSRCNVDGQRDLTLNDTVSADIKLETETEDGLSGEDVPISLPPNMYHPRHALRNAIKEWLPEFSKPKAAWGPIVKPQPAVTVIPLPIVPSINTCMTLTSTTTTTTSISTSSASSVTPSMVNQSQLQALAEVCSTVTATDAMLNPIPGPVMNSLVSDTKVVCNETIPNPITPTIIPPITVGGVVILKSNNDDSSKIGVGGVKTTCNAPILSHNISSTNNNNSGDSSSSGRLVGKEETMNTDSSTDLSNESSLLEPMDCCNSTTPNISPAHGKSGGEDVAMSETSPSSGGSMQVEVGLNDNNMEENGTVRKGENELTFDDLSLLCDLFYLPFEHGGQALQLLQEFNWLKSNAHVVIAANRNDDTSKAEVQEWLARAEKMNEMTEAVNRLFRHLSGCSNREILYDLYSYLWDIRGVISLLNSYVKWLGFSKGWKETFMSGEQEPWVFRGGLTADLQRLIPVDSGNDLFVYKVPEVPTSTIYTIRPYFPSLSDEENKVYGLCARTHREGLEDPLNGSPANLRDILGDRFVGPYLTLHPEFCFVVEDDRAEIVGFACASPDYKKFRVKMEVSWIPEMCEKYPPGLASDDSLPDLVKESVAHFYGFKEEVYVSSPTHPSSMICSVLPSVTDQSVSKRLVTCLLAALRANGSFGVHVVVDSSDSHTHGFYGKLGFVENTHEAIKGKIVMGRTF